MSVIWTLLIVLSAVLLVTTIAVVRHQYYERKRRKALDAFLVRVDDDIERLRKRYRNDERHEQEDNETRGASTDGRSPANPNQRNHESA